MNTNEHEEGKTYPRMTRMGANETEIWGARTCLCFRGGRRFAALQKEFRVSSRD